MATALPSPPSKAHTLAWSQNLGHSDVLTTFTAYGDLSADQQAEIIRGLGRPRKTNAETLSLLEEAAEVLRRAD